MNLRTTATLFGLLLVLLLVFGLAVQLPTQASDPGYLFPSIADNPSLKIGTIVITRKDREIQLVHEASGWKLKLSTTSATARADKNRVERIVDEVQHARRAEEALVTAPRQQLGLEPPVQRIVLKEEGTDREWTLELGDRSPDKEFLYAASSERRGTLFALRASSVEDLLLENADELRARELIDINDNNTKYISIQNKEKGQASAVALRKGIAGLWLFEQPKKYGIADFASDPARKAPGVKGVIEAAGVRVAEVKDFEPLGGRPLEEYGLAAGHETLRLEVERTEDTFGTQKEKIQKETLLVGKKIGGQDKKEEYYYVRRADDDSVARVPASRLEPLFRVSADPAVLRSRDLSHFERATIDVVDLRWGPGLKEHLQLRRPEPTLWQLQIAGRTYKANETAVSGDRDGLLTILQGQGKVEKYLDPTSDAEAQKLDEQLGLTAPQLEVKLYLAALEKKKTEEKEKKEEKKTNAQPQAEEQVVMKKDARPVVTLLFGKTEKDLIYVKYIHEDVPPQRVAVPASLREKILPPEEGALVYLDTTLPTFQIADVIKVELDRGPAGKFLVEKSSASQEAKEPSAAKKEEKKESKTASSEEKKESQKEESKEKSSGAAADKTPTWRLLAPKDLPGRTQADTAQVERLLNTLAQLRVERWLRQLDPQEKSPKALAEYQLETPRLVATVTLRKGDKTETFIYKFGKEIEGKTPGVAAWLNQKAELVFLAQPQAVKVLQEVELRDLTLFRFEAAQVQEMTLRNWQETLNYVLELDLEHGPSGWQARKPAGFEANSKVVSDFVRSLAELKAQKLIALQPKSLAEYKLAANDSNLQIVLKLKDGKTTYQLTVGALNADKTGYYVTASTLPQVVLLVNKDLFEPVLRSHTYFSRQAKHAP